MASFSHKSSLRPSKAQFRFACPTSTPRVIDTFSLRYWRYTRFSNDMREFFRGRKQVEQGRVSEARTQFTPKVIPKKKSFLAKLFA